MKRLLVTFLLLIACTSATAANPTVEIRTSQGLLVVELFEDKAPESVRNFIDYVNTGFYDGTIFHRVIDGFMIQGGGFDAEMRQKPTRDPIRNEAKNGLRNEAGTLAMARTREPHSASSQFFINLVNNDRLDHPSFDGWGYAVFGKVREGFDVVQKIGRSATGNAGPYQNVPVEPIMIESMRLIDAPAGDGPTR